MKRRSRDKYLKDLYEVLKNIWQDELFKVRYFNNFQYPSFRYCITRDHSKILLHVKYGNNKEVGVISYYINQRNLKLIEDSNNRFTAEMLKKIIRETKNIYLHEKATTKTRGPIY